MRSLPWRTTRTVVIWLRVARTERSRCGTWQETVASKRKKRVKRLVIDSVWNGSSKPNPQGAGLEEPKPLLMDAEVRRGHRINTLDRLGSSKANARLAVVQERCQSRHRRLGCISVDSPQRPRSVFTDSRL